MAIELERKLLVVSDGWRTSDGVLCRQGYLLESLGFLRSA